MFDEPIRVIFHLQLVQCDVSYGPELCIHLSGEQLKVIAHV
jgi:hypothetical protein